MIDSAHSLLLFGSLWQGAMRCVCSMFSWSLRKMHRRHLHFQTPKGKDQANTAHSKYKCPAYSALYAFSLLPPQQPYHPWGIQHLHTLFNMPRRPSTRSRPSRKTKRPSSPSNNTQSTTQKKGATEFCLRFEKESEQYQNKLLQQYNDGIKSLKQLYQQKKNQLQVLAQVWFVQHNPLSCTQNFLETLLWSTFLT